MNKLLDVKKIGDSKFEVLLSKNGEELSFIVGTKSHKVESIEEPMYLIIPEDNELEFFDIWGQSFELRQEIGQKIQTLINKPIPELQTA